VNNKIEPEVSYALLYPARFVPASLEKLHFFGYDRYGTAAFVMSATAAAVNEGAATLRQAYCASVKSWLTLLQIGVTQIPFG
jgi:hypothetical protein